MPIHPPSPIWRRHLIVEALSHNRAILRVRFAAVAIVPSRCRASISDETGHRRSGSVTLPELIEYDCAQNHEAQYDVLRIGFHPCQVQSVVQCAYEKGADESAEYCAFSSGELVPPTTHAAMATFIISPEFAALRPSAR